MHTRDPPPPDPVLPSKDQEPCGQDRRQNQRAASPTGIDGAHLCPAGGAGDEEPRNLPENRQGQEQAHKIAEAANTTPGKVSGRTTGQYQRNSPRNTLHGSGESPGQRLR